MPRLKTKDGTEIYYKDWGAGQPVVFSHGWPLSADAFEDQMFYLAARGYRVIAHDRRGHGRSLTDNAPDVMFSIASNTPVRLGIGKESVTSKPSAIFPYMPSASYLIQ